MFETRQQTVTLLTTSQMNAADEQTVASGKKSIELMEAAAAGVVREIRKRWQPRLTLVLCGPGNNGGDAYIVASLLDKAGWPVRVAAVASSKDKTGDAKKAAAGWNGDVVDLVPEVLEGCELIVDGIYGAGLSRDIEGVVSDTIRAINELVIPTVAVDIPSGVHGDTGAICGVAIKASLTVNFFCRRPGHWLYPGRRYVGQSVVVDIGIPLNVLKSIKPLIFENSPFVWGQQYPVPADDGHKYDRGHAIVVSGTIGKTGASRLAARAALRAGAGAVTLAGPPSSMFINSAHLTAVMTETFRDPEELSSIILRRMRSCVLVGPGNGVGEHTQDATLQILSLSLPTVLDADALTSFEANRHDLLEALHDRCVLTPHQGEFQRLFGDGLGKDKLSRALSAASSCNAIIIVKGADTVVASPDGRAVVNCNAPAELATAGSGDVLAGIVTGLLAQGMPAFEAACAGVWLHSASAREVRFGLIAEDIAEALPTAIRDLFSRYG